MVDIQTVSIAVASAGVFTAAVYYMLQFRHQRKIRQTDLVVRLYSSFTGDDFLVARAKIRNSEFEDYMDFVKKYGSLSLETPLNLAIIKVASFYDEVGTLLHRRLIDADLVSDFMMFSTIISWNKLKPVIQGYREEESGSGGKSFRWFEFLYNEMKKREQKLQQSGG